MTEPPAGMFDGEAPIDTNADLVSNPNFPTTSNNNNNPNTNKPTAFTQPMTYLFLLLVLALLLLLGTVVILARRRAARRSDSHRAGVHALTLDVEAIQHPRALSPSIPLPPPSRGWRFTHLLHLPTLSRSRASLSTNADWDLDIDDAGFAPPPYEAERKGADLAMRGFDADGSARMSEAELLGPIAAAGRLPGYEEAMDDRCFRADEVSPRTVAARSGGGGVVRVPERAARRASDGGQVQRSGEGREDMRDDEGWRERNSQ